MTNSYALREWFENVFEESVDSSRWARFERDHALALAEFDQRVAEGDEDRALETISNIFYGWMKTGTGPVGQDSQNRPDSGEDRRWPALAQILVMRARAEPDVVTFRREVLGEDLIPLADVPAWIKQTAEADGPATRWVPHHDPDTPDGWTEVIRYVSTYEGGWVQLEPIRFGGCLAQLRSVARRIAYGFGWPEEWMVAFILTDEPPRTPMTFGWSIHRRRRDVPTMSWIELRVNPYAVSPRELESAYRKLRTEHLGMPRVDLMKEDKAKELAVHRERTKLESTSRQIVEWNRKWSKRQPKWKYSTSNRNYRRDAKAAHLKATGEVKRETQ